mgnify:FL=1
MITKADLGEWVEKSRSNTVNYVASDACDLIRNSKAKLAPDVSFTEFTEAILHLCDWVPSVSMGWPMQMRSYVCTAALTVFDRNEMAGDGDSLGVLFERADGYLRELRDSKYWNGDGFVQLKKSLQDNIDLMPVESYKRFMEEAASYGLKHYTDGKKDDDIDNGLFYGHEEDYRHKQLFTNQALKAIINHGFTAGTSTEALEETDGISESLKVSDVLLKVASAGVRMPAFQLDILQVSQLMERLILSFLKADDADQRTRLSDGVEALAAITLRAPGEEARSRTNCFRPYFNATNWRIWMDTDPLRSFAHAVAYFAESAIEVEYNPKIATAVKTLRMQLLIDGTLTAQAMGRQATTKTVELNKCRVIMGDFVRKLMIPCEQYLMEKGALNGLDIKARTVLISLLPQGATKIHLLKNNQRAKGQVLMDDIGL